MGLCLVGVSVVAADLQFVPLRRGVKPGRDPFGNEVGVARVAGTNGVAAVRKDGAQAQAEAERALRDERLRQATLAAFEVSGIRKRDLQWEVLVGRFWRREGSLVQLVGLTNEVLATSWRVDYVAEDKVILKDPASGRVLEKPFTFMKRAGSVSGGTSRAGPMSEPDSGDKP